jgi:acyl dehydratase
MRIRYTQAVRFGDTIRVILKIVDKRETKKTDRGIITSEVIVLNQKDEPVLKGEWVVMMYRKDRRTNLS